MISLKSTNHTDSAGASRQSTSNQDIFTPSNMDILDAAQSQFSFSSVPQNLSNSDHPVSRWMAEPEDIACHDTHHPDGQLYLNPSEKTLLNPGLPPTSDVPWDSANAMENSMLNSGQPMVQNRYPYSESSGSLDCGSELAMDRLTINPAINVPHVSHPGFYDVPLTNTDMFFHDDLLPRSISQDGDGSDGSPPLSPDFQGQIWTEQPVDYGVDVQDATHENANVACLDFHGYSQQGSWPPSPPISDGGRQSRMTSRNKSSTGTQLSVGHAHAVVISDRSTDHSHQHRYHEPHVARDLTRLAAGRGRNPCLSSRPVPRTLRPASEKPRGHDQVRQPSPANEQTKFKDKAESAQPRNHQLYKALAGEDGLFRCPFAKGTQCSHPPTKQKCGYDKYLDSHLKPYQCKHHGCQELKFSSNACLFRHEREAHGMHFYGKNPHRCLFAGCDRSIEGFPRRWNLRDHMRRVHKYDVIQAMDSKDEHLDGEMPGKRKNRSGSPSSSQMKRTSSSQAKVRAASSSYSRDHPEPLNPGYKANGAPTGTIDYDDGPGIDGNTGQPLTITQGSFYAIPHSSRGNIDYGMPSGFSYA